MKLQSLYVRHFQILREFTLDFPDDPGNRISVFIGVNGSGKSTVLEVLARIFSHALREEKAAFEFVLTYQLRKAQPNGEVRRITVQLRGNQAGKRIEVKAHWLDPESGETLESFPFTQVTEVLPDSVVIYYAGLAEMLKKISSPHLKALSEQYRKGDYEAHQPFFYFEPLHGAIFLMSLLAYEYGDVPRFLAEKGKISSLQSITIKLQKPEWAKASIAEFWGAQGIVRNFLDYLNEQSANPKDLASPSSDEAVGNMVIEAFQDEKITITIIGQQRLFQIREYLVEERKLFEIFNIMLVDGMLEDISFALRSVEDDTSFSTLSEGEWQAIIIRGMIELLAAENALFLFDEPDTYRHPQWQRGLISEMEEAIQASGSYERDIVLTTHSPTLLSNARPQFASVHILENGKLIEQTPHYYGREVGTVLYELMGVEERNEQAANLLSDLFTELDQENLPIAIEKLKKLETLIGSDDPELMKARIELEYLQEDLADHEEN